MKTREIKFRFWRIEKQEMSLPRDLSNDLTPYGMFPSEYEIMQFTGLFDKNGKEIYEGDIFECIDDIGIVNWYGANFQVNWCPTSKRK